MNRRQSALREIEVSDHQGNPARRSPQRERPASVRFRSQDDVHIYEPYEEHEMVKDYSYTGTNTQDLAVPTKRYSSMFRYGAGLLLLAFIASVLQSVGIIRHDAAIPIQGVSGNTIPQEAKRNMIAKRASSATDWCFKWAQMSAVVNGTLYLYGGNVATEHGQEAGTWTNDFVTLDLTQTWPVGSPTLKGLPQPDGPPAVAIGALWNDYDSLYQYGGYFSSNPTTSPLPFSTWEYDIKSGEWIEHSDPTTSAGKNAPDNNQPVLRSAEGATVSVPSLGRGFYFGGHQDLYTVPGWDISIWRIYLQSLLEYTFPGYANNQVNALSGGQTAGDDGVYRNLTEGSLQDNYGFTKRADGLLMYVPGFGDEGVLVALAGGTNESFVSMSLLDGYQLES